MARGKLHQIVNRELKHEVDTYEPDPSIQEIIRQQGFNIRDESDNHKVCLSKSIGDTKLLIEFKATTPEVQGSIPNEESSSSSDDDKDDGMQKDLMNKDKKDAIDLPPFSVDYTVYVQSPKGETIAIHCNSSNSIAQINYIHSVFDLAEYRSRSKLEQLLDYNGPPIDTLDEKLRTAFYDYLISFGINGKLNSAIEALAIDKEQRMYMDFLKRMERFL